MLATEPWEPLLLPIKLDSQVQLRTIVMAPNKCCPRCPHKLPTMSGLYHHRGACTEYKRYTAAHWTLRHQLELEATMDATTAVKRPRTLYYPQGQQCEQGAMQFPVTGPIGGNVMAFPQTGLSQAPSHCLSPTPQSLPASGCNVHQTEPLLSRPPSPMPLNPPLPPHLPGPASPLPASSQSGRPQRIRCLPT